jgi:hypothetical protein
VSLREERIPYYEAAASKPLFVTRARQSAQARIHSTEVPIVWWSPILSGDIVLYPTRRSFLITLYLMTRKGIVRAYLLTSNSTSMLLSNSPSSGPNPTVNSGPDKSRRNEAKWGCVGNVRSLRLPSSESPRLLSSGYDGSDGLMWYVGHFCKSTPGPMPQFAYYLVLYCDLLSLHQHSLAGEEPLVLAGPGTKEH